MYKCIYIYAYIYLYLYMYISMYIDQYAYVFVCEVGIGDLIIRPVPEPVFCIMAMGKPWGMWAAGHKRHAVLSVVVVGNHFLCALPLTLGAPYSSTQVARFTVLHALLQVVPWVTGLVLHLHSWRFVERSAGRVSSQVESASNWVHSWRLQWSACCLPCVLLLYGTQLWTYVLMLPLV